MNVFTQSLADLFKQLLQSLQSPFLFPAAIFTFVTSFLFAMNTLLDPFNHMVFLFGLTTLLSYLLYALNIPIIRVMEGYTYPGFLPFRWAQDREKQSHKALRDRIDDLHMKSEELTALKSVLLLFGLLDGALDTKLIEAEKRIANQLRPLRERWELRYPPLPREPLPTAFGNTIAAFEAYPGTRYEIDAVHMWPRLAPVLAQNKFAAFVQQEKGIMDFLLNTCLVLLAICVELLVVFAILNHNPVYLGIIVVGMFVAYLLYKSSVVAAEHWGGMVRVAFDLYREDLRKALYLPQLPSGNLEAEKQIWCAVSNFFVFGTTRNFSGFLYPKDDSQCAKEEKK